MVIICATLELRVSTRSVSTHVYIYWCVIINPWLVSPQARRALGAEGHTRTACIDSKCIDQKRRSRTFGPRATPKLCATLALSVWGLSHYTLDYGNALHEVAQPHTRAACIEQSVLIPAYIYWCDIINPWLVYRAEGHTRTACDIRTTHRPEGP